jgi:hypothetical protein
MTKQGRFLIADVTRIRSELAKLPEHSREEISRGEAIAMLMPEIRALRRKGYSLEDIAKLLGEKGFAITAAALKKHLGNAAAKSKRGRRAAPTQATTVTGCGAGGTQGTAEVTTTRPAVASPVNTSTTTASGSPAVARTSAGTGPAPSAHGGALPGWSKPITLEVPSGGQTATTPGPAAGTPAKTKGVR